MTPTTKLIGKVGKHNQHQCIVESDISNGNNYHSRTFILCSFLSINDGSKPHAGNDYKVIPNIHIKIIDVKVLGAYTCITLLVTSLRV